MLMARNYGDMRLDLGVYSALVGTLSARIRSNLDDYSSFCVRTASSNTAFKFSLLEPGRCVTISGPVRRNTHSLKTGGIARDASRCVERSSDAPLRVAPYPPFTLIPVSATIEPPHDHAARLLRPSFSRVR